MSCHFCKPFQFCELSIGSDFIRRSISSFLIPSTTRFRSLSSFRSASTEWFVQFMLTAETFCGEELLVELSSSEEESPSSSSLWSEDALDESSSDEEVRLPSDEEVRLPSDEEVLLSSDEEVLLSSDEDDLKEVSSLAEEEEEKQLLSSLWSLWAEEDEVTCALPCAVSARSF